MCVFCGENANEKSNERENASCSFADLNFFFVFFLCPFSPTTNQERVSHLFGFFFSLFSPKKRRESLKELKNEDQRLFLIPVSPILSLSSSSSSSSHHAPLWSSSLSSSSGVLLRAFGVFARGGRAKNNDA